MNRDKTVKRLLDPEIIQASFETLDSLVYFLGWNFKFNPSTGIFNSVINSGKIELISVILIQDLYTELSVIRYGLEPPMAHSTAVWR